MILMDAGCEYKLVSFVLIYDYHEGANEELLPYFSGYASDISWWLLYLLNSDLSYAFD